MKDKIKIRFPNELWWDEISLESFMEFLDIEISFMNETYCFIRVIDKNNNKFGLELFREDYNKIIDQKAFRMKFNLEKHNF